LPARRGGARQSTRGPLPQFIHSTDKITGKDTWAGSFPSPWLTVASMYGSETNVVAFVRTARLFGDMLAPTRQAIANLRTKEVIARVSASPA